MHIWEKGWPRCPRPTSGPAIPPCAICVPPAHVCRGLLRSSNETQVTLIVCVALLVGQCLLGGRRPSSAARQLPNCRIVIQTSAFRQARLFAALTVALPQEQNPDPSTSLGMTILKGSRLARSSDATRTLFRTRLARSSGTGGDEMISRTHSFATRRGRRGHVGASKAGLAGCAFDATSLPPSSRA